VDADAGNVVLERARDELCTTLRTTVAERSTARSVRLSSAAVPADPGAPRYSITRSLDTMGQILRALQPGVQRRACWWVARRATLDPYTVGGLSGRRSGSCSPGRRARATTNRPTPAGLGPARSPAGVGHHSDSPASPRAEGHLVLGCERFQDSTERRFALGVLSTFVFRSGRAVSSAAVPDVAEKRAGRNCVVQLLACEHGSRPQPSCVHLTSTVGCLPPRPTRCSGDLPRRRSPPGGR